MEITDIRPADVDQIKFQIDGDMSVTIALVMQNGSLEIITGASLQQARELQDQVKASKLDRREAEAVIVPPQELDPHENEPGPPVSQHPCEICGERHDAEGPLVCICVFCHRRKEIFHLGACQECVESKYGHYYEMMEIPIQQTAQKKEAWEL